MSGTKRVVVIGGDAAGMSAASQLRRMTAASEVEIVAFERGPRTSYAACGLPYLVEDLVGSPDDLLETIAVLQETTGGFGTLLFWANEWAPWPAVKRSYELIARYVIPEVQGLLAGARSSNVVARDQATRLHQLRAEATARATESAGGPAGT